jgi:hypothetical protein
VSLNTRFHVGGAWRLGPRLTAERLSGLTDGSSQTTYIPSMLLDYQRGNKLPAELVKGAPLSYRRSEASAQNCLVLCGSILAVKSATDS